MRKRNILGKGENLFFLESVKPASGGFQEAVDLLEKEYSFIVGQTLARNHMSSLRIEYLVRDDVDTAATGTKAYKCKPKMSRHMPESHRSDSLKIEFLRKAIIEQVQA